MRYAMSALLAVACLITGCASEPPANNPPGGTAAQTSADGALSVQLKTKDGNSFVIHVPPANGKPQKVAGMDDLFVTFMDYCLEAFPDDAGVAAKAKAGAQQVLTDDEVKAILHGDPGQGWVIRLNHSAIRLTLERPPHHSCAVRAILPTEPDVGITMATYVGLWGFTQSPPETLTPGPVQSIPAGSAVQTGQPFILTGPDRQPIEEVTAFIVHDPNSQQVELRLVRLRGNNPR
jgi:hypothetical protein